MQVILKIDINTKKATLETVDDSGKVIEFVDGVKEFSLHNFGEETIGIAPQREFMIAGTATTKLGDEIKIQRFMNRDNSKFDIMKSNQRRHPSDNGNRLGIESPIKEIGKSGVIGFMDDVIIRTQPRG